jgi:hypothetical protein
MSQWYFSILIISLYVVNAGWLLLLGNVWGAGYWFFAGCISICAMMGLTR